MGDWTKLCRAKDLELTDTGVRVSLFAERNQHIRVQPQADHLHLSTTVATAGRLADLEELKLRIWGINRGTPLIGLRFDGRDRLIAESHVPLVGLSGDELQFHLRNLAREADRLEYILTGEDRE